MARADVTRAQSMLEEAQRDLLIAAVLDNPTRVDELTESVAYWKRSLAYWQEAAAQRKRR